MKSMTCKELGGACDETFTANTFEEIAEQSKQHGMAMFQQQDADHLAAMAAMKELMQNPQAMQAWYEEKKKAFETLPEAWSGCQSVTHRLLVNGYRERLDLGR